MPTLPAFPLCRAFFKTRLENSGLRSFSFVFSYLRIDVSLNAIIYLRQTRGSRTTLPQRGSPKEARELALMIYRGPIQLVYKLLQPRRAKPHSHSSIVSPSIPFFIAIFFPLYMGGISLGEEIRLATQWTARYYPGSPSILKSPSIIRIGRSNIIIMSTPSIVGSDQRPAMARETREICRHVWQIINRYILWRLLFFLLREEILRKFPLDSISIRRNIRTTFVINCWIRKIIFRSNMDGNSSTKDHSSSCRSCISHNSKHWQRRHEERRIIDIVARDIASNRLR